MKKLFFVLIIASFASCSQESDPTKGQRTVSQQYSSFAGVGDVGGFFTGCKDGPPMCTKGDNKDGAWWPDNCNCYYPIGTYPNGTAINNNRIGENTGLIRDTLNDVGDDFINSVIHAYESNTLGSLANNSDYSRIFAKAHDRSEIIENLASGNYKIMIVNEKDLMVYSGSENTDEPEAFIYLTIMPN